ncbi:MAG: sugar transporter ATP-binding protein [Firmicutes bacterium]|nr:sugar transporter ATP-binding protein [Bacillota bacterium]
MKLKLIRQTGIHVILAAGGALMLLPVIWMIATSFKEPESIYAFPPEWLPHPFTWSNYVETLTRPGMAFLDFFRNSMTVTVLAMIGNIASSTVVAFAFARLRWRGRDALFVVLLTTMMLPQHVTMIPVFVLFKYLGWIDTYKPLVVPAFFGAPLYIFILRQFMLTLPRSLDEAARLDGAGNFTLLTRIMLPLSKPALATVAVFAFRAHWNDFMGPLIYLNSSEKFTLAIGLHMFHGQYGTEWGPMMAAATLTVLPMVILFLIAQRYFIQGMAMSGLKE